MAALTKAELDETTREWREDLARRGHSVGAPKQPVAKGLPSAVGLSARDKGLLQGVAESIAPYLKRIEQLEQRVAELEASASEMKYCGVWREGKTYSSGSFATHDGAMFHANRKTSERPGSSGDWVMAAKSGQPVPHPRSDATTVTPRSNGHYARARVP
jgi:hypothetical protein